MALHRQGSASQQPRSVPEMNGDHWPSGSQRTVHMLRHEGKVEHKAAVGSRLGRQADAGYDYDGAKTSQRKDTAKGKRALRTVKTRKCSLGLFTVLLLFLLGVTILFGDYFFVFGRPSGGGNNSGFSSLSDQEVQADHPHEEDVAHDSRTTVEQRTQEVSGGRSAESVHLLRGHSEKRLSFGQNVKGQEDLGQDSRAWDSDDRDRSSLTSIIERNDKLRTVDKDQVKRDRQTSGDKHSSGGNEQEQEEVEVESLQQSQDSVGSLNSGLYNEKGRKELRMYEKQFEAALKKELSLRSGANARTEWNGDTSGVDKELPEPREVTEGVDPKSLKQTGHTANDRNTSGSKSSASEEDEYDDYGGEAGTVTRKDIDDDSEEEEKSEIDAEKGEEISGGDTLFAGYLNKSVNLESVNVKAERLGHSKIITDKPLKPKKRRVVPCEIPFANITLDINEPEDTSKFANFSLQYIQREERPVDEPDWEPRFAGHQSMGEREKSFFASSQTLHCGFVQGPKGYPTTGYEISEADKEYLNSCRYAVSSGIFNNSDHIRSPTMKKVSPYSKNNVCFVMFVDQSTLDVMIEEKQGPNLKGRVGLWRVVLVKNMPFNDGRRTGKVPKLLTHRLFPSARYSIWLDSKLRLQTDPILIFEYFLWRKGAEYAISNHYDRHDVGEEVLQNKKLNKFNHTIIDEQYRFYQQDGLTKFNASDPKRLLPSYVPEGSFIVRAHTPMSNLFSCLWFNEVDRFTPRDQLSFAYTYLKLVRMNPQVPFAFHMFKDCERKSLAKLFRHRHEDKPTEVTAATETSSQLR